jgi:SsrA-binding protein
MESKLVAENRKARFDYFIQEEIEAGLVLSGTEVKSLREGKVNINDAHAAEMQGTLWIFNINIPEYKAGNRFNHEPKRPRKLLLHQKQINKLMGQIKIKGLTLVPLKMYFNERGIAKILLGLGKGKREFEKRDATKDREWKRAQSQILKNRG